MAIDDEEYPESYPEENRDDAGKTINNLPMIVYYQRSYALSLGENDPKATAVFKQYESVEKLRRLQSELLMVKSGLVTDACCDRVIGKKRKAKHASYEHWGELMLLWIVSAKN